MQAEQELVTAQGVIDSLRLIHPGTVKRVLATGGLARELTPVVQKVAAHQRGEQEQKAQENEMAAGVLGEAAIPGAGGQGAAAPKAASAFKDAVDDANVEPKGAEDGEAAAAAAAAATATTTTTATAATVAAEVAAPPAPATATSVAGSGGGAGNGGDDVTVSATDAALLERVKFALSRFDFTAAAAPAAPAEPAALAPPQQQLDGPAPGTEAHQLYAMFEFMRSGDTRALLPANAALPGPAAASASATIGGGGGGASAAPASTAAAGAATAATAAVSTSEATAGSSSSSSSGGGGGGGRMGQQQQMERQDVVAQDNNWNDFLQQLVARFPPRREIPVRERLAKRIAHAKDTAWNKLEHSRDDPINLYSSQPIEEGDTLSPRSPRVFSTEERE